MKVMKVLKKGSPKMTVDGPWWWTHRHNPYRTSQAAVHGSSGIAWRHVRHSKVLKKLLYGTFGRDRPGAVPCHLRRLMVLDSPGRDPRGDKVSIVFVIEVLSEALQMMCAGSDAKRIIVRRIARRSKKPEVGFDHWRVIQQLQQERSES